MWSQMAGFPVTIATAWEPPECPRVGERRLDFVLENSHAHSELILVNMGDREEVLYSIQTKPAHEAGRPGSPLARKPIPRVVGRSP